MNSSQERKLRERLENIENHGGSFALSGGDQGSEGVLGGLSCLDDISGLLEDLDNAIQLMKFRQLPNQYIPRDEGDAPRLDFKVDCSKGSCPVGSRWNRKATDGQRDADWS